MDKNEITLTRNNTFKNDVVLVDGQGRSGKNLIAVLLSSMERVEKMRLDSHLDYIPRYWALGKMNEDAAITAMKLEYDENLYYSSISRDINFRIDDYSGVLKQAKRWTYIKRLFKSPYTVDEIQENGCILQEMTHNGIQFFELHLKVLGDRLKMIHLIRNPIRNIYEQNRRGIGERVATDPSELQLTYSFRNQIYPYTAMGAEELYQFGNPLERLVTTVAATTAKNVQSLLLNRLNWGRKIIVIDFETFVTNPKPYLTEIEGFIKDKFTKKAYSILKREKCPRNIDLTEEESMYQHIKKNIRIEYSNLLDNAINDYILIKEEYSRL
jgi:hypothetical protein